jgi:hypothetical protein
MPFDWYELQWQILHYVDNYKLDPSDHLTIVRYWLLQKYISEPVLSGAKHHYRWKFEEIPWKDFVCSIQHIELSLFWQKELQSVSLAVDTVYSLEYTVDRKMEMRASLHVRLLFVMEMMAPYQCKHYDFTYINGANHQLYLRNCYTQAQIYWEQ